MKSFLFYLLMLLLSIMIYRSARAQITTLPAYKDSVPPHYKKMTFPDTPKIKRLHYPETGRTSNMDSIPFLFIGDRSGYLCNRNFQVITDTLIVTNWFHVKGDGQIHLPAARRESDGRWIVNNDTAALETMHQLYMKLSAKYNAARKILDYMKTDGTITNWKKWKAAVNEYIRLNKD